MHPHLLEHRSNILETRQERRQHCALYRGMDRRMPLECRDLRVLTIGAHQQHLPDHQQVAKSSEGLYDGRGSGV